MQRKIPQAAFLNYAIQQLCQLTELKQPETYF